MKQHINNTKMKLKTLFLAALAVLAIASCDSKKKMILGVQLDPAEIYLTKEDNASSSFEVYASDSWTVKSTADWLNISQDKGKGDASLSVWAASANTGKPRKATIVFRCGYYHYATLTVTQQGELEASDGSSPEKAFSPQEAREFVLDPSSDLDKEYFIKGKIHKIKESFTASGTNGNASFYISEDGKASDNDFYCYRVLYLGNRTFKSGDKDISVGDDVIVYGVLTNYEGTPETDGNNAFVYQLNDLYEPVQTEFEEITIAEFLERKDLDKAYDVSGKVTSVTPSGSYFGANIKDGGKELQCAFPSNWSKWSDKIVVGGTMKIRGKYSLYNGSPQMNKGKILSFEEGQIITVEGSVSQAVEAEDGAEVTINEGIVAALTTKGFVLTDGTNNIYVYLNATPSVKIGYKIKLEGGSKTTYRDVPEVEKPSQGDMVITTLSQNNEVPRTELTDITATHDSYSSDRADYIKFTGALAKNGNYYNITKTGSDLIVSAQLPAADIASVLDGLNNSEVTIVGYYAGNNTDKAGAKYLNIIVTEAAASGGAYCRPDKTEISVAANVTSAKFNISANADWTLQAPDTEGFQSLNPLSGSANAEVTATFTANTTDQSRTFEILLTCESADVSQTITITQRAVGVGGTIADALAAADNSKVEVNDAIVAALTTKGFNMTDGINNIYVYTNTAPTVEIGDQVSLGGTKEIRFGVPQIKDPTNIQVGSKGNEVPRTEIVDLTNSVDSYNPPSNVVDYISFTGKMVKSGSNYQIKKDGATRYLQANYATQATISAMETFVDQEVIVKGYFASIHSTNNFVYINITDVAAADPNAKYCRVTEGYSISVAASATSTTLHVKANAAWSITPSSGATVSPNSGNADAAVTVSFAANTATSAKTYTLTLVCADAGVNQAITITQAAASSGGSVTDVLNNAFTGVSGTSYTAWTNTGTSGATYAGQSAGGNSSIQLRSSNSNSGIVTTKSGGKVRSIVITWNVNTQDGRTLDIYGDNSAYTDATQLYNSDGNTAKGTKLGSIVKGTSTTLTISSDYTHIGLRSNSGAMYLDKIEIEWAK